MGCSHCKEPRGNPLCKDEKKIQSAWRVPPFCSDRPWLRIQQPDPGPGYLTLLRRLMWLTCVSDMYNKFFLSFTLIPSCERPCGKILIWTSILDSFEVTHRWCVRTSFAPPTPSSRFWFSLRLISVQKAAYTVMRGANNLNAKGVIKTAVFGVSRILFEQSNSYLCPFICSSKICNK